MTATHHPFDVLQHGVRLNIIASHQVKDVNAAHFAVHSVLTEAMRGNVSPVTFAGLEAELTRTLAVHTSGRAPIAAPKAALKVAWAT